MQMPVMDGWEAAEKLRAWEKSKSHSIAEEGNGAAAYHGVCSDPSLVICSADAPAAHAGSLAAAGTAAAASPGAGMLGLLMGGAIENDGPHSGTSEPNSLLCLEVCY
jgi:CheY-like chemotaxis protein